MLGSGKERSNQACFIASVVTWIIRLFALCLDSLRRNIIITSFGFQWNRLPPSKLDSHSGIPVSRDRFFRETGWSPESLLSRAQLYEWSVLDTFDMLAYPTISRGRLRGCATGCVKRVLKTSKSSDLRHSIGGQWYRRRNS